MLVDRLLDGGDDDLLFLCPDGGVEREHGDTRVGDAEVALQRLGKGADAVGQTLFGNLGKRSIFYYGRNGRKAFFQYQNGI